MGGREGIIFYLISALSFSITCMSNNEEYFVTLIGKYVNETKYLIFYIMSSALCILTSNFNGLKHDPEHHMSHSSLWNSKSLITEFGSYSYPGAPAVTQVFRCS